MKIKKFSATNFGCLRNVTIDLGPLTVLVGPNNAGKSMILRAIERFSLATVAQAGWVSVYGDLLRFAASTFDGTGNDQAFTMEGTISGYECRYHVNLGHRGSSYPEILEENLEFLDHDSKERRVERSKTTSSVGRILVDGSEVEVNFVGGSGIPVLSRRNSMSFSKVPLAPNLKDVFDRIPQMARDAVGLRRFALTPGQLRTPIPEGSDLPEAPQLRSDGWGLAGAIANILLGDRDTADAIEGALRRGPSGVKRLKVERRLVRPADSTEAIRAYDLALETTEGASVSSTYISDGVLLYMAYLVLTMGPSSQSILLLEEPETGIHPGLLEKLVQLLRGITQGSDDRSPTQVIMTTHSPILLNFIDPSEIRIVCRGADGGTVVSPFAGIDDLHRLLEFQGPGEVWANMGEDLLLKNKRRS